MNTSMANTTAPSLQQIGLRMFAALLLCTGLAACEPNDGPIEQAGETVDEAATDTGNEIEDKCEEAKESMGMQDTRC